MAHVLPADLGAADVGEVPAVVPAHAPHPDGVDGLLLIRRFYYNSVKRVYMCILLIREVRK